MSMSVPQHCMSQWVAPAQWVSPSTTAMALLPPAFRLTLACKARIFAMIDRIASAHENKPG